MESLLNNPYVFFYGILILSFVLMRIPKLGKYLRVLNTLIHESGHALLALITNGSVYTVSLRSDTSGEAVTGHSSFFSKFLVALAGYPITALASVGIYWCVLHENYRLLFVLFTAIAIVNLLLWVRNSFGVVWLIVFIAANAALLYFQNPMANKISAYLFAAIVFIENIYSSLTIFIIACKNPKSAGDAANLAKLTKIPAVIWALLFAAFNIFMGYWVVRWFFPL